MDINKLDLNLLLLLDKIYSEKNLSSAARQLSISQPMASLSLKKLRDFFGDQLFQSTGRGMRPTPFTESIAGHVRAALTTIRRDILQKSVFRPEASDATFRISMSDIGALIFVPPLLRRLSIDAPNVSLSCASCSHEQLESALADAQVDLAVGYFPDLVGANIGTQHLFDHVFTCIVRNDHPTIGSTLSLDEFLAADHLVVSQEGRSQEIFERRLHELNLNRRVRLHLPHFMSVPQIIANSDMIATVPMSLGAWYANSGIRLLPPPITIPAIELKLHWHTRMDDEPANAWLRGIVMDELRGRDPILSMTPGYLNRSDR
jgi:DNA-binding transcriptional LysR family regulator